MSNAHNSSSVANFWGCIFGSTTCIFFAKNWRILSKSYFAMEGGHRRLKCMLRNSGVLSLLWGRVGVQVVVDNHTIDDSLATNGWDATKEQSMGKGPLMKKGNPSRTRRRFLTGMQHLRTGAAVPMPGERM